jgi:aminoglycoside phosphotransferase (APT) family kinase protein
VSVSTSEVDSTRLREWLMASVPSLGVSAKTGLLVSKISGGYSNLTFGVVLRDGEREQRVILRRGPVGVHAERGAHDMRREFRVLTSVWGTPVPVPEPIALCEDPAVIGGMFFLMAHVDGVAVRRLDDAPVLRDAAVMRQFSEMTVDALALLHGLPAAQSPLFDASRVDGYGLRQVQNWHARWTHARPADVTDADATFVFDWLAQALPEPMAPTLLHNDWKFDNLLVDPTDPTVLRAVLDWEMATVGDPRFDLATALGYWVQPNDPPMLQALALGVTNSAGCISRAELIARYATARGITIALPHYWYAFGLAKVAVIVLQLYARYVSGASTDPRYASLGKVAALLMRTARVAIEQETVESL